MSLLSQSALQFLEAYGPEDVTVAELQGSSNSLWTISPPSREYLSQVLHLDHFPLTLSWTIQRSDQYPSQRQQQHRPQHRVFKSSESLIHFLFLNRNMSLGARAELASGKHVTYLDDQTRLELIQLLNGTRTLPV